ncbi:hypothetical protein K502DRAFT_325614 [Neoconidiobolus thromboides FSU 785]|nr:hypothetical protein K502DRAFT_325614 [Neoconidiobolus thromboides FSU 785]
MGKSAKFFKRPNKKEKEYIKIQKEANKLSEPIVNEEEEESIVNSTNISKVEKNIQQEPNIKKVVPKKDNNDKKIETKKGFHPYKVENKKKKNTGKILEGRPDYVDLMFGRTKSKKKLQ